MPTLEEIDRARTKGEATRLRNLLRKQTEYRVLSRNETVTLKRLLAKRDAEDTGLAQSFQFRKVASEPTQRVENSEQPRRNGDLRA